MAIASQESATFLEHLYDRCFGFKSVDLFWFVCASTFWVLLRSSFGLQYMPMVHEMCYGLMH